MSKFRHGDIDPSSADVNDDVGNFSGNTNLLSLLEVLGTFFDDNNIPLGDILSHAFQIYKVTGTPTATRFDLAQVTGGPAVPGTTIPNGSQFVVLTGAVKGRRDLITVYTSPEVRHADSFTPAVDDLVLLTLSPGKIGDSGDAPIELDAGTGDTVFAALKFIQQVLTGTLVRSGQIAPPVEVAITDNNNAAETTKLTVGTGKIEIIAFILRATGVNAGAVSFEIRGGPSGTTTVQIIDPAVAILADLNAIGKQVAFAGGGVVLDVGEVITFQGDAGGDGAASTLEGDVIYRALVDGADLS